ncbi:MAG: adenylyltransferase/cytidyltransferase family protein, partial [Methylophaga sp.]|nr:adenylyltransferase/cytidyltransferase family protein [Methylophaga sp.]
MADSIGILGGTFDPIHFGHLRPALDVAEQLGLDRVHLIPSARPPHRDQPQATAEQRLTMLHLAVKNNPQFVVDDRELHREGASYTVDTLVSLRQDFPDSPLYLMVGT